MSGAGRQEARIENNSEALGVLSRLLPDADPGVLMGAAKRIEDIAEAAHGLIELGVALDFSTRLELTNGAIINIHPKKE